MGFRAQPEAGPEELQAGLAQLAQQQIPTGQNLDDVPLEPELSPEMLRIQQREQVKQSLLQLRESEMKEEVQALIRKRRQEMEKEQEGFADSGSTS